MAEPKLTNIPEILGLNNVTPSENMKPGELEDAENINLHTDHLERRDGFSKEIIASISAAWSNDKVAVYQSSDELYRVINTGGALSTTLIKSGLFLSDRIDADEVNGRTYLSNGTDNIVIENGVARTWGLEIPIDQPMTTQIAGLLPEGFYMVAATFGRDDGQESGTSVPAIFSLDDNSGIDFFDIPVSSDPSVITVKLYLTTADGEVLYLMGQVDNGVTTFTYIGNGKEFRLPLKTSHMGSPPAGNFVEYFKGRVYVAQDNILYQSEPYNYELFDLRKYHKFSSDISLLGAVDNGLYLATQDETFFLSLAGSVDFKREKLADYGAILGTMAKTDASRFGDSENIGEALIWWSKKGLCVGLNNGNFKNVSEKRYIPSTDGFLGTGFVRQIDDEFFYLAAISQV